MKKIVLTGGGTAGHVTPHFALLPYLKKHFDEIIYLGVNGGIEQGLALDKNLEFFGITATKLKRGFHLENLGIPFKLVSSIGEAKKILKEVKPNVVFSKGGYVGLPVTVAAKSLKIPVVLHESDLSLGLSNKLALPFADKLLTTFNNTAKKYKKGEFVGAIVREELFKISKEEGRKYYKFLTNKPVILITGGSQGAKILNDTVHKILPSLLNQFNVLHLVGKGNASNINYNGYKQVEFTDMKYAYAVSDYCISRAGSNTAFELLFLNIPSILVPLPKGNSRGDQIDNALFFKEKGVFKVIMQENLTAENLKNEILNLKNNANEIIKAQIKLKYPLANAKIAQILNKY